MFIFNALADLNGKIGNDGNTVKFNDPSKESLRLEFKSLEEIDISKISTVQRPIFEDLLIMKKEILRI